LQTLCDGAAPPKSQGAVAVGGTWEAVGAQSGGKAHNRRAMELCFWEPISRTLNIFFNEEDE